jgi:hypothetical protein
MLSNESTASLKGIRAHTIKTSRAETHKVTKLRNEIMRKDDNNQNQMSNTVKDPDEWTTGDERMTGAQRSYLKTLSDEAGVEFDENLTKAEASKRIEELQQETGRGLE